MRKLEEHSERTGKDRWLVSYADFITLLFAFFVVMYAISSLNNEKYRILSETLNKAFPESFPEFVRQQQSRQERFLSLLASDKQANKELELKSSSAILTRNNSFENGELKLKFKKQFETLILAGKILVRDSTDWLEIQVSSNLLFGSGSSFLNNEAEFIIQELADTLKNTNNRLSIEGFTDNVPIHNTVFPSNWELSADRAATVARAFIMAGIPAERLAVVGYGENFPVADNKTAVGRQQNRRIIIVIEKENKRKDYLEQQTGM